MCHGDFGSGQRQETPAQRRRRHVAEIKKGQAKVHGHIERLRTEAPRIYAALMPLLQDLGEWMDSVGAHIEREEQRLSGVA